MFCESGIDWGATGSMLQAFASFANVLVILLIAYFGRDSLKRWLQRKHTERQIEVGEEILTIAYAAADAFEAIRVRGVSGFDNERAKKELADSLPNYASRSEQDKDRLQVAQVVLLRIHDHHDLWMRCQNALPSARAVYSIAEKEALQKILGLRAQVMSAAQTFAQLPQWDSSMAKIFLNGEPTESDPIRREMRDIVAQLETTILPKIRDRE